MTDFEIISDSDTAPWQSGFERRLRAWYASVGFGETAIDQQLGTIREEFAGWTIVGITAAGTRVGHLAVAVNERNGALAGRIGDLWVEPEHSGQGYEQAARAWAESWCAEQGARTVGVRLTGSAELFADYPVRAQSRMRVIDSPAEPVNQVTARAISEDEYPGWLAAEQAGYVAQIIRAGHSTPEQARKKSDEDFGRLLPQGRETPANTIMAMELAGEVIGTGWLRHGHLPGVSFGYSLEVHPEHRSKGYGRDALAIGERATLAGGDSAMMFNVFGGNEIAMNLYTSAGYLVVDETRSIQLPRD